MQNSGGTVNGQYIAIMDSYIDGGKIIAGYDYGKDTYNNETYSKYSAINIVNSHIAEGTTVAAVGKLTGESTSTRSWVYVYDSVIDGDFLNYYSGPETINPTTGKSENVGANGMTYMNGKVTIGENAKFAVGSLLIDSYGTISSGATCEHATNDPASPDVHTGPYVHSYNDAYDPYGTGTGAGSYVINNGTIDCTRPSTMVNVFGGTLENNGTINTKGLKLQIEDYHSIKRDVYLENNGSITFSGNSVDEGFHFLYDNSLDDDYSIRIKNYGFKKDANGVDVTDADGNKIIEGKTIATDYARFTGSQIYLYGGKLTAIETAPEYYNVGVRVEDGAKIGVELLDKVTGTVKMDETTKVDIETPKLVIGASNSLNKLPGADGVMGTDDDVVADSLVYANVQGTSAGTPIHEVSIWRGNFIGTIGNDNVDGDNKKIGYVDEFYLYSNGYIGSEKYSNIKTDVYAKKADFYGGNIASNATLHILDTVNIANYNNYYIAPGATYKTTKINNQGTIEAGTAINFIGAVSIGGTLDSDVINIGDAFDGATDVITFNSLDGGSVVINEGTITANGTVKTDELIINAGNYDKASNTLDENYLINNEDHLGDVSCTTTINNLNNYKGSNGTSPIANIYLNGTFSGAGTLEGTTVNILGGTITTIGLTDYSHNSNIEEDATGRRYYTTQDATQTISGMTTTTTTNADNTTTTTTTPAPMTIKGATINIGGDLVIGEKATLDGVIKTQRLNANGTYDSINDVDLTVKGVLKVGAGSDTLNSVTLDGANSELHGNLKATNFNVYEGTVASDVGTIDGAIILGKAGESRNVIINNALNSTKDLVTINGGVVGGSGSIASETTDINGGTINIGIVSKNINVNDGTVELQQNLGTADGAVVTINGATIGSDNGSKIVSGTTNIKGGTINVGIDSTAINVNGGNVVLQQNLGTAEGAVVTINGGSISSANNSEIVSDTTKINGGTVGVDVTGATTNIHGGIIDGNVTSGTINISGTAADTAITLKGTIGTYAPATTGSDGAIIAASGSTVTITQGNVTANNIIKGFDVTIDGGTIGGTGEITGGTTNINGGNVGVKVTSDTTTITGGTISGNVESGAIDVSGVGGKYATIAETGVLGKDATTTETGAIDTNALSVINVRGDAKNTTLVNDGVMQGIIKVAGSNETAKITGTGHTIFYGDTGFTNASQVDSTVATDRITVNGGLTIASSGVVGYYDASGDEKKGSNITINDGSAIRFTNASYGSEASVMKGHTITINGGTLSWMPGGGSGTPSIQGYKTEINGGIVGIDVKTDIINISGGTVSTTAGIEGKSDVTITGGTVTSVWGNVINVSGTSTDISKIIGNNVTISGGAVFEVFGNDGNANNTITISGGTVEDKVISNAKSGTSGKYDIVITGGAFGQTVNGQNVLANIHGYNVSITNDNTGVYDVNANVVADDELKLDGNINIAGYTKANSMDISGVTIGNGITVNKSLTITSSTVDGAIVAGNADNPNGTVTINSGNIGTNTTDTSISANQVTIGKLNNSACNPTVTATIDTTGVNSSSNNSVTINNGTVTGNITSANTYINGGSCNGTISGNAEGTAQSGAATITGGTVGGTINTATTTITGGTVNSNVNSGTIYIGEVGGTDSAIINGIVGDKTNVNGITYIKGGIVDGAGSIESATTEITGGELKCEINSGTINIKDSVTLNTLFEVGANSVINVTAGTVTGDGSIGGKEINVSGGDVRTSINSDTTNLSGTGTISHTVISDVTNITGGTMAGKVQAKPSAPFNGVTNISGGVISGTVNSGDINVTGDATVSGTLGNTDGTSDIDVTNNAVLNNTGTVQGVIGVTSGSAITGSGTTVVNGGSDIAGTVDTTTINVHGNVNVSGTLGGSNSTVTVNESTTKIEGSGTVGGNVTVSAGSVASKIDGNVINISGSGKVDDVKGNSITISGGTITGDVISNVTSSASGVYDIVVSGGKFGTTDGNGNKVYSNIEGYNVSVKNTAATQLVLDAKITADDMLSIDGNVKVNGGTSSQSLTVTGVTIDKEVTATKSFVANNSIVDGVITAGTTVAINGSNVGQNSATTITANDVVIDKYTKADNTVVDSTVNATINATNSVTIASGTVDGTIKSATTNINGGTLNAVIDSSTTNIAGGTVNSNISSTTINITNSAVLNGTVGGQNSVTTISGGTITTTGNGSIASGTTDITGGATIGVAVNSDKINVNAGSGDVVLNTSLGANNNNSVINIESGNVSGTGTIGGATTNVSGGTVSNAINSTTTNLSGTGTITGTVGGTTMNINGGTLAEGAIVNSGTTNIKGGTVSGTINSTTTNISGGTINTNNITSKNIEISKNITINEGKTLGSSSSNISVIGGTTTNKGTLQGETITVDGQNTEVVGGVISSDDITVQNGGTISGIASMNTTNLTLNNGHILLTKDEAGNAAGVVTTTNLKLSGNSNVDKIIVAGSTEKTGTHGMIEGNGTISGDFTLTGYVDIDANTIVGGADSHIHIDDAVVTGSVGKDVTQGVIGGAEVIITGGTVNANILSNKIDISGGNTTINKDAVVGTNKSNVTISDDVTIYGVIHGDSVTIENAIIKGSIDSTHITIIGDENVIEDKSSIIAQETLTMSGSTVKSDSVLDSKHYFIVDGSEACGDLGVDIKDNPNGSITIENSIVKDNYVDDEGNVVDDRITLDAPNVTVKGQESIILGDISASKDVNISAGTFGTEDNKVEVKGNNITISCEKESEQKQSKMMTFAMRDVSDSDGNVYADITHANLRGTGGTLTFDGWSGGAVNSIDGFNTIEFKNIYLAPYALGSSANVKDEKAYLTINNAVENGQVVDNGTIDMRGVTIKLSNTLYLNDVDKPLEDEVETTLIAKGDNVDHMYFDANKVDSKDAEVRYQINTAWEGVAFAKPGDTTDRLTLVISSSKLAEQTTMVSESRAAATAFVNQGAELAAQQANALANSGELGYQTFAGMYGNHGKVATGSHVEIDGNSFMVGVGNANADGTSWGVFYEGGRGNYTTYNSHTDLGTLRGDGNTNYNGGGVLLRKDKENGWYAEGSLRMGRLKNSITNLLSDRGTPVGYDTESTYYGGHVGIGKVSKLHGEGQTIDTYAKFFYTHHDSDTYHFRRDDYRMDATESETLRLGFRVNQENSDKLNVYYGLAWEYEFDGDVRGQIMSEALAAPSLGGSTILGELGISYKASSKWNVDARVQGYGGQRDGISGSVNVNYLF
ncbi:hypothetical protein [Phascolarctobacterium sp.]|uniref:hypothetical protein n=1 Tax=Phascolarctobacterium sp. TaxID=2049039 RepID=UPI00386B2C9F